MNKLFLVLLLVLAMGCVSRAQDQSASSSAPGTTPAESGDSPNHSALSSEARAMGLSHGVPSFLLSNARVSARFGRGTTDFSSDEPAVSTAMADPTPAAPAPRFVFGGRDDFRWQMGLGISIVRFRSKPYYATGVGTDTSVTYFTNDWFGLEGRVTTAFSPTTFSGDQVKLAGYGVGPKLAWRDQKFEPFIHGILGGIHVLPQTALGSANGFEFQLGGGMGYRFNPRLSTRLVVDWVRTRLFGQWQDNAQVALQSVLHF
jgi:hypothetical protein